MDTDRTARLDGAQPQPKPDAVTAVRYGHVVIQRKIGGGGMGEVFLGFHEGFQIPVVVKLLPESFNETELVDRFLREAQVAVRLEHANIVRVFDVGRDAGRVYMVMEHVEGQDLEMYAKDRGGRLPIGEALDLIGQAARGLAYAHGEGVIHRDIKPANLMRRVRDGRVKVLDFGLARAAGMDQLTSTSVAMGTLPFMAFEQIEGHAVAASDVYALGVSLYRLISGRHPAIGPLDEMLRYHREGSPAPLSNFRPVPEPVQALVSRMLAKRVGDRPEAKAVASEIEGILAAIGDSSSAVQGGSPSTDPSGAERLARDMAKDGGSGPEAYPTVLSPSAAQRPHRRWGVIAAVVGAVLCATVAALTWPWGKSGEPSAPPVARPSPGPSAPGQTVPPLRVAAAVLVSPPIVRGAAGIGKQSVGRSPESTFPREVVHKDDGIRFAFESEEALWVYVMNVDGKGNVYCLYPDVFQAEYEDEVRKGNAMAGAPIDPLPGGPSGIRCPPVVHLATGQDGYWTFRFDDTQGEEWFLVVASREKVPELEAIRERLGKEERVESADVKTLASRWAAEMEMEAAKGEGQMELYASLGEKVLGSRWSCRRGPGRAVWTVELDHR